MGFWSAVGNPLESITFGAASNKGEEDSIKPEKFDIFDEYMAEIRNFELNPNKPEPYPDEESLFAEMMFESEAKASGKIR